MNRKTQVRLSLLAVIAVAAMIFFFSAQQGDDSSELSGSITEWALERVVPAYATMTPAQRQPYRDRLEHIVRKLAHFSEFALLAVTLARFFYYALDQRTLMLLIALAWIAATLYAGTDELHQMFVAGRGPSLRDVGIDSLGALAGACAKSLTYRRALQRARG